MRSTGGRNAYALLPAGIKQNPSGIWESTDLSAADARLGAPGGKLRVYAAAILMQENPDWLLITGGDMGYDVGEGKPTAHPTLADILQRELLEIGVPSERIILERNSNTTYQELQELQRIVAEHGIVHVSIVSNRWHMPRLEAMIEAKFADLKKRADLLVIMAEDVLIADDPKRWRQLITDGYASQFMIERAVQEQLGVAQIRAGTYTYR